MSQVPPPKHKRAYCHRVICSICQKEILAKHQTVHAKTKHKGKKVKFTVAIDATQSKLCFTAVDKTTPVTTLEENERHIVSENADESEETEEISVNTLNSASCSSQIMICSTSTVRYGGYNERR